MPVPSGLGMVIPKSIDRDLEDLCKILGDTSSKERSRQTLQAADELDNNIVAYYDLTRRQVERTMDRLRKFRERGSTHSGVPGSCSAEPATWRSLWMWWRGARVTTRGDVMATRLDELRELLHGRHQDMDAARHHASGGRADQLSRVVEGSCHYARAAREYVGLQIGSGGVVEGIEGSERAGKAVGEKDAGRVGGDDRMGDDAGTSASVSKVSEAATGLQAVCVATLWSKERHEELADQIAKEAKLLGRTIIDVDYLRDTVRRTYARDGAGAGWCEQEDVLLAEVEAEVEALIAKYLKTLEGYFGRVYD